MQKMMAGLLIATSFLVFESGQGCATDLQGSWSGGGPISFATGAKEYAKCRARYTRASNEGYVVSATCATASARAVQTATLRKIADNGYRGTFYNHEYGISGTITVIVRGATQSVSLTSDAGWASLKFSK
jgi:hypothetical protein